VGSPPIVDVDVVIETYLSRARAGELEAVTARLRQAIASSALTIDRQEPDPPVRWLRSYFVPDDEVCFHVIEADSAEAALTLGELAGLSPERVVRAESSDEA
jgi:uncharacterized protein DUF4242